eukprot:SAG31_NODE_812_length_11915_cov_64.697360_13_plen_40_part_00
MRSLAYFNLKLRAGVGTTGGEGTQWARGLVRRAVHSVTY